MAPAEPKPTSRGALLGAVAVYFVVKTFVPFGGVLLYPLTLLSTWVHEMGHGVTALLCGGHFASLDVFANGSGLAYTATSHPWQAGLVAAGGLVAPPIVGAGVLAVSGGPRRARIVMVVLAVAIALSLAVWVRSLAGWIALPLVAAFLAAFARWGGPKERMIAAQLVGVALAADTWSGKDYLFSATATVDGATRPSDIINVAHAFGGPYLVWGAALAVLSFALLALGLRVAWRKPRRPGEK
jgi:Peptidase M50B-like